MRVALCQINPTVGDIAGNARRILAVARDAHARGATLAVFPELALPGYPPRDLLDRRAFVDRLRPALDELARDLPPLAALVGFAERNAGGPGRPVFNAAGLLEGGRVAATYRKRLLPTYDVFDEDRHFEPGSAPLVFPHEGRRVGVTICEDLWTQGSEEAVRYRCDPLGETVAAGAELVVNLSASPFSLGKDEFRQGLFRGRAARHRVPIVLVNQVGGNDELIFDGHSLAVDALGRLIHGCAGFASDLAVLDPFAGGSAAAPSRDDEPEVVRRALELGLSDYVRKCGLSSVALGLSGGIDSAVVAVLAAEALGPDNVRALAMPSRFSSPASLEDARAIAGACGIRLDAVSIEAPFGAYLETLRPLFGDRPFDVAEENLQARIRGALLMAVSNKFGPLILSTGNKSEIAAGYATLYGDMCGGLAPIGDLVKRRVYELARHLNAQRPRIPARVLERPPSAELRPDQKDEDSLPPYAVLDGVIERHVEGGLDVEELVAAGFERALCERVVRMVQLAEYKRRQGAPVLKLTRKAFGSGRRLPIAQAWSGILRG
ncbi:MAG: NAD+ synthase [Deltaproteobacteria bacterium]|nr:NAD+ synthase [Deltaproteobacteria bacterium]